MHVVLALSFSLPVRRVVQRAADDLDPVPGSDGSSVPLVVCRAWGEGHRCRHLAILMQLVIMMSIPALSRPSHARWPGPRLNTSAPYTMSCAATQYINNNYSILSATYVIDEMESTREVYRRDSVVNW